MFTFYCDFWVLLMYDILIILICFLVPTRKAVKHKHLEILHLSDYNTRIFYQFINIKTCQSPYTVKHALHSYFPENLMPLRRAVLHSGQYRTDSQSYYVYNWNIQFLTQNISMPWTWNISNSSHTWGGLTFADLYDFAQTRHFKRVEYTPSCMWW